MNTSTDETVISGATESISTIQRFEPAILQQQSYLPSIGVDTGMKTFNYSSTISSSLVSDTPEETKSGFIEKHKRLLVWSGFIIAAVVVVKLI